jgi:hypothetical protein
VSTVRSEGRKCAWPVVVACRDGVSRGPIVVYSWGRYSVEDLLVFLISKDVGAHDGYCTKGVSSMVD